MEPLIIKVWKGGRSQPVFHRVTHTPFTIGRAFDNDLIIADETVSPHQLRLTATENGYQIEDLGSENGSWIKNRAIGQQPQAVQSQTQIEIGRTHLALISADAPVTPTHAYKRSSAFTEFCARWWVALVILALFFLLAFIDSYAALSLSNDWQQMFVNRLPTFLLPLGAAFLTGLLGRILVHRWRYWLQLSIASVTLVFLLMLDTVGDFLEYFLTSNSASHMVHLVLGTVGFILLLRWQLSAVSTMKQRNAALTSVGVVVAIITVIELQDIVNREEFNPQPQMHNRLSRFDLRVQGTEESLESYMSSLAEELETGVQQELRRNEEG